MMDFDDYEHLKLIIERAMAQYPHGAPHPETVEALARGLVAVIDVSNSRPERYSHEPWLGQSAAVHAEHAVEHATSALGAVSGVGQWLTDIMQPEIAHCCMRAMLCLHKYNSDRVDIEDVPAKRVRKADR